MENMPMIEGLDPGMLVLLGLVVAAVIEPIKTVAVFTERRLIPLMAMVAGVVIAFLVIASPEMSRLQVFSAGALIGLSAIGGREAVRGSVQKKENTSAT